uniref:Uncharacterized protein n=1 Tax=Romanomermis culicivorax TaxID=13658 RepID=A0A915ISR9_ROMCU
MKTYVVFGISSFLIEFSSIFVLKLCEKLLDRRRRFFIVDDGKVGRCVVDDFESSTSTFVESPTLPPPPSLEHLFMCL